jgi:hypothetical protein
MAMGEMLKFLYNLTFHVKVQDDIESPYVLCIPANNRLVSPLVELFLCYPAKEFRPPLTNVIHGLLNLPLLHSQSTLFPNESPMRVVQHIVDTLNRTIPQDTECISDTSLDENLSPVFALLSNIYDVAPTTVKPSMKEQLLPTEAYIP